MGTRVNLVNSKWEETVLEQSYWLVLMLVCSCSATVEMTSAIFPTKIYERIQQEFVSFYRGVFFLFAVTETKVTFHKQV